MGTTQMREALEKFLNAPTTDHQTALMSAADGYREEWIEAKATGNASGSKLQQPARKPRTTYEREIQVRRDMSGIPVRLALQERKSEKVGKTWWVLSWRTNLESSGRNRRFYFSAGNFWSIPASDALELMEEMDARGGLDDQFLDVRQEGPTETVVSTELDDDERAVRLAEITAEDEDWGEDPFFVIASDPNSSWQKVMLVDRETGTATFRSITTDPEYRPKKDLRPGEGWWLDNSMMDANVQQMRQFLRCLREFLSD
jgi:hypothetical protein